MTNVLGAHGEQSSPPSMVERLTLILDAFDHRPTTRLTLDEIAARTALPRSTTHRILSQLVGLEWLESSRGQYSLGRRALRLSGQGGLYGEVRRAAADTLHRLALRTGLVVHLAALHGRHEVFLDKVGGRFATALPSTVGTRHHAYLTSGGRAMLAWLPPEEVDELFDRALPRVGDGPGWDLTRLHRELSGIRRARGVSIDRGDQAQAIYGTAVPSVAAAIRDDHRPVAAICVCGEADTVPFEPLAPLVVDAAAQISRALHPTLSRPAG